MPTNAQRAIRARTALIDHYDSLATDVIEMLTDLMHMCRGTRYQFRTLSADCQNALQHRTC